MKTEKRIVLASELLALALLAYLLIFPEKAVVPTREALVFCSEKLIPSLFVCLVLSKLIVTMPITARVSRIIGLESTMLLLGTLCGFPTGAKNAMTLYESGMISKKHAEYLCSFSNNASVSFIVGFVGGGLFGSAGVGVSLLLIQLFSSAATAFIMKRVMFGALPLPKPKTEGQHPGTLREAIADSAMTMLNVCACLVFFYVSGSALLSLFPHGENTEAVIRSLFEFSSGCAAAAKSEYPFVICAFALGFSGLSVLMQVSRVLSGKLSAKPFFAAKLINAAIMTLLSVIIG